MIINLFCVASTDLGFRKQAWGPRSGNVHHGAHLFAIIFYLKKNEQTSTTKHSTKVGWPAEDE